MRVLKYGNSKFRGLCPAHVLCAALVCSVLSIAPGCATLGPTSLPADRFNYNKSLARSANEQLLLNIVRLRYGEPLHWLEVSSMLSQYSLEASVNASSWWNDLDTWGPALRAVYGQQLDRLDVDRADIEKLFYTKQYRDVRGDVRVVGTDAWVRFHSCKGYLVIDLDSFCRVRQVYTRGQCKIPGI